MTDATAYRIGAAIIEAIGHHAGVVSATSDGRCEDHRYLENITALAKHMRDHLKLAEDRESSLNARLRDPMCGAQAPPGKLAEAGDEAGQWWSIRARGGDGGGGGKPEK